jgi:hypothetical protein
MTPCSIKQHASMLQSVAQTNQMNNLLISGQPPCMRHVTDAVSLKCPGPGRKSEPPSEPP